jgi:3-hydroxyisobutyrate dehydrogenase-like beta-hydroxyacid dehydrogenase
MKVGLLGSGHMGAGLGWALLEGGAEVFTTLAGRSERSARFARHAGLTVLQDLDELVRTTDIVLVVTPPGVARAAAAEIAAAAHRSGARPLVADLNAIAPATASAVADILAGAGLDFVDGSISGPPPWVRPGARLYFSGPRAAEVENLPWRHVVTINLGPASGSAKALKMSTASVYKGLVALFTQAIRSAHHHDVLEAVLADLSDSGYDLLAEVAVAAAKSSRYVAKMHEIAITQQSADLDPSLFTAVADVWADVSRTALAADEPETARTTNRTPAETVSLLTPLRPE